jgi:hypothetical protein
MGRGPQLVGQRGERVEHVVGAARRGDLALDDGVDAVARRVEREPEDLGAPEVVPDDERGAGAQ